MKHRKYVYWVSVCSGIWYDVYNVSVLHLIFYIQIYKIKLNYAAINHTDTSKWQIGISCFSMKMPPMYAPTILHIFYIEYFRQVKMPSEQIRWTLTTTCCLVAFYAETVWFLWIAMATEAQWHMLLWNGSKTPRSHSNSRAKWSGSYKNKCPATYYPRYGFMVSECMDLILVWVNVDSYWILIVTQVSFWQRYGAVFWLKVRVCVSL